LLVALSLCAVVLGGSDHEWTSDGSNGWYVVSPGIQLKVEGSSGKLQLRRREWDEKSKMEVNFDKLEEISASGSKTQNADLSGKNFVWGTPVWELRNGVNTTRVNFTSSINPKSGTDTSFAATVYLYQEDGTITHGGDTYTVKKDRAKFTINIKNWPFESSANTLRLTLELKVNDKSYKPDKLDDKEDGSSSGTSGKNCKMSDLGEFEVLTSAVADGVSTNITADLYTEGSKNGMVLTFPYFASELDYDPTLFANSATLLHSSSASFIVIALTTMRALL
jgi:hypothetical protein